MGPKLRPVPKVMVKLTEPSVPSLKVTDPGVKVPSVAQAADPVTTRMTAVAHIKNAFFMVLLLTCKVCLSVDQKNHLAAAILNI